ncbi:lytic transglycosylase domain-containing protein [Acidocella sp.]|uniref:lytic transglycosylase domain-containing protein n=1 Tax=Acidocella sp. TaxID=50710 RepID=UPI00263409C3|nr:lytic transglycosylase domain-containing protein [Acidocella sp.]
MGKTRMRNVKVVRKGAKLRPRLAASCAGMALLSACAAPQGQNRYTGETTSYYLAHAAHNYNPPGPPGDPWGPYIKIAAAHFDVPEMWIRQVMRVESGGHEYSGGHLIVSSAGAMGLMQLEPGTYQEMAERYGLGDDPFNPYDNIMAGTAYIHEMYQVYGSPGFLAAYNAGPGRLDAFMNYKRSLPSETINYVAMIAPNIEGYYPQRRSAADELALNTEPLGESGGILPSGFTPQAPQPSQLSAPVRIASLAPVAVPDDTGPAPVTVPVSSILPPAAASPPPAPVQIASIAPPAAPAPQPPSPAQIAAMSSVYTPPAVTLPPPPPVPVAPAAPVRMASALPAPPPHPKPQGFSLIPPAMADTPPVQAAAFNSGQRSWGIQVGAYDSPSNARAALGMAELTGARVLTKAQPVVMTIHAQGRVQYRARFVGLQREEAVNACTHLAGGPTGCVVLSPDAQS